ncbi:MAG: hypothetical protein JNK99_07955 [Candidatus Accumulibacter sp.]|uniref:hypothetical protein n=1 Tax=Accumulibacter sp. TaxID=2053492 RepID=UPI001A48A94F|nr:hypothetical protein [Accumulibacter sp.]MBL8394667.1 hypothetical protein [Accumulibacter sp.]
MSLAENLRAAVDGGLSGYETAGGVGPDAYCAASSYHPMADGKYLQILATLRRSRLLSEHQFEARVAAACGRLARAALCREENGWCWGLGFPWRGLPAAEPFLITSALIVRGALDCRCAGSAAEPLLALLGNGVRGLGGWIEGLAIPVGEHGLSIPAYSPGIRAPIYNAAACAYATLKQAEVVGCWSAFEAQCRPSLQWIGSRRVAGLGWPYSPASPVVDLLHQCYILNAMGDVFGTDSIERAIAEMVGQFAGACGFADVIHLVASGELEATRRDIQWLRPLGEQWIEVLPKPARLWSLGELLVVVSRLGLDGESAEAWFRLGRRLAESILQRTSLVDDVEAKYPRHLMHALHGLSAYLALQRERARRPAAGSSPEDGRA